MNTRPPSTGNGIGSIETGLQILVALAQPGTPQMLKTIAEKVGMHPSKVHRYLVSFLNTGFVVRDAENGRYKLGPMSIRTGLAALHDTAGIRESIEIATALRDKFDQTAIVTIWGSGGPVIAHMEEASNSQTSVRVGTTLPILSSASGQVFASLLANEAVETLIKKELESNIKRRDDRLISTKSAAAKLISGVRKSGIGAVNGELSPGLQTLAAAIKSRDGQPLAAIAVTGRSGTFSTSPRGEIATSLLRLSNEASQHLASAAPGSD